MAREEEMEAKSADQEMQGIDQARGRQDIPASVTPDFGTESWRLYSRMPSRRSLAQVAELSFYVVIAFLFLSKVMYEHRDSALITVLTKWDVIAVLLVLFFVFFLRLLTGTTPLVGLIESLLRISSISFGGIEVSLERAPGSAKDEIERLFDTYLRRSNDAMDAAKRRPNALILVGTVVAFVGLVFFILTLPGSRYGFFDATPQAVPDLKADFWSSAIQLLPRLLMLIFIQILAGFFLRQYRSSMEEFRYYEAVLRHREDQRISYLIRLKIGDSKALMQFAGDLLKEREFGRLTRGDTTAMLEAQRAEANEFLSLYERLAAFVKQEQKKAARKTESASKRNSA
jgi:hypothetical protein